jgi:hypothetical protein
MKLSIKGLALTAGILWGAACFGIAFANQIWPEYGDLFLAMSSTIYPGYHGPTGFVSVIVVTLYALVDGAVCGAVFAWLYNQLAGKPHAPPM